MAKDDPCYFTFHTTAPIVGMLHAGEAKTSASIPEFQSPSAALEWANYSKRSTCALDPKDYVVVRGVSLGTVTSRGAEEFALDASDMTPAWTLVRGA